MYKTNQGKVGSGSRLIVALAMLAATGFSARNAFALHLAELGESTVEISPPGYVVYPCTITTYCQGYQVHSVSADSLSCSEADLAPGGAATLAGKRHQCAIQNPPLAVITTCVCDTSPPIDPTIANEIDIMLEVLAGR